MIRAIMISRDEALGATLYNAERERERLKKKRKLKLLDTGQRNETEALAGSTVKEQPLTEILGGIIA